MKCPKCDQELTTDDIEEIKLREIEMHARTHVYVCKKCGYIIGVGACGF